MPLAAPVSAEPDSGDGPRTALTVGVPLVQPAVPCPKLLFLIRSLSAGGAERQLVLLARELKRRGIQVSVATYYPGGAFERELTEYGIGVHCLGKRGRWDLFGFLKRLLAFVTKDPPALVHGYLSTSNLLLLLLRPILKRRGMAVVCGVRADAFHLPWFAWPTRLAEAGQLSALRFADLIICNSTRGRDRVVAAGASLAKCSVIDNGIDSKRFQFSDRGRIEWRARWGIQQGHFVVGTVGRHDPVKGLEYLISAAKLLIEQIPSARFVVVGSGELEYSDRLRSEVRKLGLAERWIWQDPTEDLPAVYSAMDVFCLASTSEGFPNVVGEAMSVGLPCVATDVGDTARLMGGIGWTVAPRSEHALHAGLIAAIGQLSGWNSSVPREWIEGNFGVDRLTDSTLKALSPWLRSSG